MMKPMQIYWLWFAILALMGCTFLPASNATEQPIVPIPRPVSLTPAMSVRVDVAGAVAWLDFCQALYQGQPWDEAAVRQMMASPPYQVLVAHHSQMDSEVTSEALVKLLLALRDDRPWSSPSERLNRIYTAYHSACGQFTTLRKKLELVQGSLSLKKALSCAQEALPPQARVEATVYLLADGRSTGYVVGKCIVLDLLQVSNSAEIEATLAHELHHIGASSLLPAPCPDTYLRAALEILTDLVQEGAATYWIDNQRFSATQADYIQIEAFLRDVLSERLGAEEIASRRQGLVQGAYGPLYQVGNEMIAALASAYGEDWVQAHLGDPVGLFRTWEEKRKTSSILSQEVLSLLDDALEGCPEWRTKLENGWVQQ